MGTHDGGPADLSQLLWMYSRTQLPPTRIQCRPTTALEVLGTRTALGHTLATACVFAPFLAYLSSSQQRAAADAD